jgi:hypothetical protein
VDMSLGTGALLALLIITGWITLAALINGWRHDLRPLYLLALGSGLLTLTFVLRLLTQSSTDVWSGLAALTQLLGLICIVVYGRRWSSRLRERGFGWRQLLLFARL